MCNLGHADKKLLIDHRLKPMAQAVPSIRAVLIKKTTSFTSSSADLSSEGSPARKPDSSVAQYTAYGVPRVWLKVDKLHAGLHRHLPHNGGGGDAHHAQ